MPSIRSHFQTHPPTRCTVCLEHSVRLLNTLLLGASLAVAVYASRHILGILHPGAESPTPGDVPWWCWALSALGLLTALASSLALLGVHYRSLALLNAYIVIDSLLMSAQLCCAVAYVLLSPSPDNTGPAYSSQRLQQLGRAMLLPQGAASGISSLTADAGWQLDQGGATGVQGLGSGGGLLAELDVDRVVALAAFGVEGLALALTCMLQSFYQLAQNMIEDEAAEEAGWEGRQPLLHSSRYPHIGPSQPWGSGAPAAQAPGQQQPVGPTGPAHVQADEWSEHMRERYGLDTSQFTYRPGPAAGAGGGARTGPSGGGGSSAAGDGSRCSIM